MASRTNHNHSQAAELLLRWYDAKRRILPWREDPTPYHVWLSEIMLQQTRVEAAKSYYLRFLEELPDVASLARAPEDQYLKLWEGLGYYSRIRNMHKAAVQIMEEHDGQIPGTSGELRKLAGIGEYTAAAIASIAFQEKIPSVDGNLLRVYARLNASKENIKAAPAKKHAAAFYYDIMPDDRPGDFNQAVMDLGATICLPNGQPYCDECPWNSLCRSHAAGTQLDYPVLPPKKKRRREEHTVLLIHSSTQILLKKRPDTGLLAGLYEFPNIPGTRNTEEVLQKVRELGLTPVQTKSIPKSSHIFSHVEWHMKGYDILVEDIPPSGVCGDSEDTAFPVLLTDLTGHWSIPSAFSAFVSYVQESLSIGGENANTQTL